MAILVRRRASSIIIIIIIIIGRGCIWVVLVLVVLVGEADGGSVVVVVIFVVVVREDTGLLTVAVAVGMVGGEEAEAGEGVWVGSLEGTEEGEGVTFVAVVVVLEEDHEARRWPLRRRRRLR